MTAINALNDWQIDRAGLAGVGLAGGREISIPGIWAPRRRPLWTPGMREARRTRRGDRRPQVPWWKRLNPFYAVDGDVALDADGNVILNDAGEVALECASLPDCAACAGLPSSITATLSIPSFCSCSVAYNGGSFGESTMARHISGDPSGTFTLTRDSVTPCTFIYTENPATTADAEMWNRFNYQSYCTPNPDHEGYAHLTVFQVSAVYTTNLLTVSCVMFSPSDPTNFRYYFLASAAVNSANCKSDRTLNNTYAACGTMASTNLAIGYGGTAALTF